MVMRVILNPVDPVEDMSGAETLLEDSIVIIGTRGDLYITFCRPQSEQEIFTQLNPTFWIS